MSAYSPLLEIRELRVAYAARGFRKRPVEVLHGVSIEVAEGETHGIVGESGSGKTTVGRAILGLTKPSAGAIYFAGEELTTVSAKRRRELAHEVQAVFQDPYTSLNPSLTVGDILSEPLVMQGSTRRDAGARVRTLLDQVGLPSNAVSRLPREFSGGQRQRVAIARALAPEPRLIVCDEPVSALDLSTQRIVLDLLIDIQRQTGVAYLFISHDLTVVRQISHRVSVLYKGDVVETGQADEVTSNPHHPYTERLLLAAPIADPIRQAERRCQRAAIRILAAEGAS